jgi:hypothetical protein
MPEMQSGDSQIAVKKMPGVVREALQAGRGMIPGD